MQRKNIIVLLLALVCLLSACSSSNSKKIKMEKKKEVVIAPVETVANLNADYVYATSFIPFSDYNAEILKPAYTSEVAYFANTKGHISALDVKTKKILWRAKAKNHLTSSLSIAGDYLLVADMDANLNAYNLKDGQFAFSIPMTSEMVAAAVYDKVNDTIITKSIDGMIQAVRINTNQVVWNYQRNYPNLILRSSASPIINADMLIIGLANGKLAAIDLENGVVEWERVLAQPIGENDLQRMVDVITTPLVVNNSVYAASLAGSLSSIGKYSGNINWEKKIAVQDQLAADDKLLFVCDGAGFIKGLELKSGNTYFKQGILGKRKLSGPYLVNGKLVVADELGYLYVFSKEKGKPLGKVNTKLKGLLKALFVIDNEVFMLSSKGKLQVIKLNT